MYGVFLVWFKLLLCYAVFNLPYTQHPVLSGLVAGLPVFLLFDSYGLTLIVCLCFIACFYVSERFKFNAAGEHLLQVLILLVVANNYDVVEMFDLWLLSFGIT